MTEKAEKAKAYLLKFTEYEAEIAESEERYLELKAKADGLHGTDYTEPRISGNQNSDRIPNWIALADEEARHYWDLKIKALDFRMDTIKSLPNSTTAIITMFYTADIFIYRHGKQSQTK